MLPKALIGALIREAALEPASVLLDARKARYMVRLLILSNIYLTAQLLLVML
jgi:hypothetical protein